MVYLCITINNTKKALKMEINNKQLEALLLGDKVVTVTMTEEMALINLLVDSGYGMDVEKEHFATGVFVWHLKSKVDAVKEAVEQLRSNGIEVKESSSNSPLTNYYKNTHYFIMKTDLVEINAKVRFIEGKAGIVDRGIVDIFIIKPL